MKARAEQPLETLLHTPWEVTLSSGQGSVNLVERLLRSD
jgi:hypothetical protein